MPASHILQDIFAVPEPVMFIWYQKFAGDLAPKVPRDCRYSTKLFRIQPITYKLTHISQRRLIIPVRHTIRKDSGKLFVYNPVVF